MNERIFFAPVLVFFLIAFFSCSSTKVTFHEVSSISELEGLWISNDGQIIEYPLESGEKRFFRYSRPPLDVTDSFLKKATEFGLSKENAWAKRFSLIDNFPVLDSNESQKGERLFLSKKRIFSEKSILASEIVAMQNLGIFLISDDGAILKINEKFKLFSEKFDDEEIAGEFWRQK